jgi:pSer/pThr/pTyr-binding forkhead associated (FHA) protein
MRYSEEGSLYFLIAVVVEVLKNAMRVQLVPIDGGVPIEITKDLVLVGRKEDCDMQLDHKSISKLHCVIVKTDGLLLVRDLGSTNGTRVNGQRIRRAALLPNDQLNIASLRFKVEFSNEIELPVNPDEYTQQMDAKDVQELLKKKKNDDDSSDDDNVEEVELPAIQANALPDVIEEKPAKKK